MRDQQILGRREEIALMAAYRLMLLCLITSTVSVSVFLDAFPADDLKIKTSLSHLYGNALQCYDFIMKQLPDCAGVFQFYPNVIRSSRNGSALKTQGTSMIKYSDGNKLGCEFLLAQQLNRPPIRAKFTDKYNVKSLNMAKMLGVGIENTDKDLKSLISSSESSSESSDDYYDSASEHVASESESDVSSCGGY
ncbi:hypothetical protein MP228_006924 [Amoeboaphelidium protococcarum]|nr:hypothetical protein MP228_006924 [Amoeboaphelidium protococcarum]